MRLPSLTAAMLLGLTVARLGGSEPKGGSELKELDDKSWAAATENRNCFIMFQASWCGYCRKMMPDMQRLAAEYKSSRSVGVFQVDCTGAGYPLCEKYGAQGFPSLKIFKFKEGMNQPTEYHGTRDYKGIKKVIEAKLVGSECSLEDRERCTPAEHKILEESEAMSTADRRAKLTEMEELIKAKQRQVTQIYEDEGSGGFLKTKEVMKEMKELRKSLELVKLGGQKHDRVMHLVNDAQFRENCEHQTCVLAFLPTILDSGAAARKEFLNSMEFVFKKAKGDGYPVGFMWLQRGDQVDIEEKMALSFGFPAVVAVNVKKERYGVHRGKFDKDSLSRFLSQMMAGRVALQVLQKGLKWAKTNPWDDKDSEMLVEQDHEL